MALFRPIELESLTLNASRCANTHFNTLKCDFCLTECPYQALSFKKGTLVLDKALCQNCGLCLQVCPQDVFSFTLEENQFEDNTYVFICKTLATKNKSILKPCHCLYNLNLDDLFLRLVDNEKLYFIFEKEACQNCHNFDKSHFTSWLFLLFSYFEGALPKFEFISYDTYISLSLKFQKNDIKKRRHFVKKLFKTSLELSLEYTAEQANIAYLREKENKKAHLHLKKWHGLNTLSKRYPLKDKEASLPYYQIHVSNCDFCAHCIRECPTGALKLYKKEAKYLSLYPSLCTNCNLCLYACPKEAISYSTPLKAEELLKESVLTLYKSNQL